MRTHKLSSSPNDQRCASTVYDYAVWYGYSMVQYCTVRLDHINGERWYSYGTVQKAGNLPILHQKGHF